MYGSIKKPPAAKSLQSCQTLCDPIAGSPPGSTIPGILQAGILEWVAISFSNTWKWKVKVLFASVQFSRSVVSDSLWPHESQHTRPPCLSPTPGAYSNSCPSSQWYHPTISSSVIPFSSCLRSFPAWGLFQGVSSLHQVAKVLELQLQHQSFQWIFSTDFL